MSSNQELPAINGNDNEGEPPCKKAKNTTPSDSDTTPSHSVMTLQDLPASLIVHTMTFCEPKDLASCRRFASGFPALLKYSPFDFCETHRLIRQDGKCGYCERGVDLCNFCDEYRPIKDLAQCGALDRHDNECTNLICRFHRRSRCDEEYCGTPLCPDVNKCQVGYYSGCWLPYCRMQYCHIHIDPDEHYCRGNIDKCLNNGGFVCCHPEYCGYCGALMCGGCECVCSDAEEERKKEEEEHKRESQMRRKELLLEAAKKRAQKDDSDSDWEPSSSDDED